MRIVDINNHHIFTTLEAELSLCGNDNEVYSAYIEASNEINPDWDEAVKDILKRHLEALTDARYAELDRDATIDGSKHIEGFIDSAVAFREGVVNMFKNATTIEGLDEAHDYALKMTHGIETPRWILETELIHAQYKARETEILRREFETEKIELKRVIDIMRNRADDAEAVYAVLDGVDMLAAALAVDSRTMILRSILTDDEGQVRSARFTVRTEEDD